MELNIFDFPLICRICLEKRKLIPFEVSLVELLDVISSVDVTPGNNLPQKICKRCCSILEHISSFIDQVKYNEKFLNYLLLNHVNKLPQSKEDITKLPPPYIKDGEQKHGIGTTKNEPISNCTISLSDKKVKTLQQNANPDFLSDEQNYVDHKGKCEVFPKESSHQSSKNILELQLNDKDTYQNNSLQYKNADIWHWLAGDIPHSRKPYDNSCSSVTANFNKGLEQASTGKNTCVCNKEDCQDCQYDSDFESQPQVRKKIKLESSPSKPRRSQTLTLTQAKLNPTKKPSRFTCPTCSKDFARNKYLNRHRARHTCVSTQTANTQSNANGNLITFAKKKKNNSMNIVKGSHFQEDNPDVCPNKITNGLVKSNSGEIQSEKNIYVSPMSNIDADLNLKPNLREVGFKNISNGYHSEWSWGRNSSSQPKTGGVQFKTEPEEIQVKFEPEEVDILYDPYDILDCIDLT